MKISRLVFLLAAAAASVFSSSCGLAPEPGWAASPPVEYRSVPPWGENWQTYGGF